MQSYYYAAQSNAELDTVCESLRSLFGLPPFVFDTHANWRFAWSQTKAMRLNVTKADDYHTVETWMTNCPEGVNYQVILSVDTEPTDFASLLGEVLGSEVARYASISAAEA